MAKRTIESLSEKVLADIRQSVGREQARPQQLLFNTLRLLAKWRAETLHASALEATGGVVSGGPFGGMKFTAGAAEGCFLPKLLGCYEAELHDHWLALQRERRYATIIDIGAAEGYYAVGLARLFPAARIVARDTNRHSHAMLRENAEANGVAHRIELGGRFDHGDFAAYADTPALVLCDIEGGEKELLDPARAPALARFDIVVEIHEGAGKDFDRLMARRFNATHTILGVRERARHVAFPPGYQPRDSIDRLISMWEFRTTPTPWLIMRARNFPG
jgi:hypothetical protein